MYDFNRPAGRNLLALSAGDSSGLGPRVQGVLGASQSGSRVYFVAQGLLTSQPNSLGQLAQTGADNLYLYDTEEERVAFVAQLCSGEEESGSLTGITACIGDDRDLWRGPESPSYITPDGRFLAFTTHARLAPDDTNEAADVYRYDAQTGALARVSVGHQGEDQNGNGGSQPAELDPRRAGAFPEINASLDSRSVSDDGNTIVFGTARPLQGTDLSGKVEAYEWHDGQVTLLSGGRSAHDLGGDRAHLYKLALSLSPSGRDIVFATEQGFLPADTDGILDIYDARVDGGFPPQPPPPAECEGAESCHGPGTHESPPQNEGSSTFIGPPNSLYCHKGFVKRSGRCVRVRKHQKHRKHHKRAHRRAPARRSERLSKSDSSGANAAAAFVFNHGGGK
jgi:hypothetical protein